MDQKLKPVQLKSFVDNNGLGSKLILYKEGENYFLEFSDKLNSRDALTTYLGDLDDIEGNFFKNGRTKGMIKDLIGKNTSSIQRITVSYKKDTFGDSNHVLNFVIYSRLNATFSLKVVKMDGYNNGTPSSNNNRKIHPEQRTNDNLVGTEWRRANDQLQPQLKGNPNNPINPNNVQPQLKGNPNNPINPNNVQPQLKGNPNNPINPNNVQSQQKKTRKSNNPKRSESAKF